MASIATVAVLGAGTMGAGIAQVVARSHLSVRLYDALPGAAGRAIERTGGELARLVERGKLTHEERREAVANLTAVDDLAALAGCDLAIEAVPEEVGIKRETFARLSELLPDALLATNTSTISVSAIAAAAADPGRVLGLHFFNPAPLMPLVEVIAGDLTRHEVIEAGLAFVESLGKTPVLAKDTPGFIVNRVARPFYGEAVRLVAAGATPETVDRVLRGAGFRMGPLELMDLIGLDVNLAASKSVYEAFFQEARYRPHPLQERMVQSGRLGRKSGRGFYDYGKDKR